MIRHDGRLMAVEALKNQKSKAVLSALTKRLQKTLPWVRIEAAKAWDTCTLDALSALLNSVQQTDVGSTGGPLWNFQSLPPQRPGICKSHAGRGIQSLDYQQVIRAMADYGNEEIVSILLAQLENPPTTTRSQKTRSKPCGHRTSPCSSCPFWKD